MHPESASGLDTKPLLEWLLRLHPSTPKTRAKQWILAGRVSVGGQVIRKPHQQLPDPGTSLQLLGRYATALECGAGKLIHPRVGLLHLDSSLAVLNKGAGIISVPAPNAEISALSVLADYLAGHLQPRDRTLRTLPPPFRKLQPLPVHRLDQYTTGIFCVALTPAARENLIAQLKKHSMRREYVAFVEGKPATAEGTWRNWLRLGANDIQQHVVVAAAPSGEDIQEAVTHYKVIAEYPLPGGAVVTQLHLRLETGRKHQIRVQAAHAGLPLIGDRVYNPHYRPGAAGSALVVFERQALHAERLTLEHPENPGTAVSWTAPWPKDLRQLEQSLRQAGRAPARPKAP
jgi:23S rRNA pseudouridine1911/1915/1917 synthase